MAEEFERLYVIPLKKTGFKSSSAAPRAIKRVKGFLTRHMKVEEDKIWIDDSLNEAIWARGRYQVPGKIRVRAVKFEDGVVEAYMPELEFKKSRRELLKEEREKKEPILKKEEEIGAEEEPAEAAGAEDYEISPTAEGEVKIKKKKTPKAKGEKKPKEKTKKKEKPVKKEEVKTVKKKKMKKPKEKTIKLRKKEGKTKTKTTKKAASRPKKTVKKKMLSKGSKKEK